MSESIKKMGQVKVGDFVRFNDKDAKGKFHYIGQVTEVNEKESGFFTMDTFQGTMSFKVCPENDLETSEKPVGWDKFSKDHSKYRTDLRQKELDKDVAPVIKTNKELIYDFVKLNKKITKPKLIKALKKEFPKMSDSILISNMELALIKLS